MAEVTECGFCGAMVSGFREWDEDGNVIFNARCPNCGHFCGHGIFDADAEREDDRPVKCWTATVHDEDHRHLPFTHYFKTETERDEFVRDAVSSHWIVTCDEVRE